MIKVLILSCGTGRGHNSAAKALTAIKKEHTIHFMQVATNYVSIPFWKETNPDYFVIPNQELKEDFINKGSDANKLLPIGIPVSKNYTQEYNKEKCKNELNLEVNKKYILILTGSMGFGNVTHMIKELLKQITEIATINKPFIHTMPIPGCENYNANFFSERKMSIKCENIQEIIDNTKELLSNEQLQKEMIQNQIKYINKSACDEITKLIIEDCKLKGNL